jgi:hypothetical protein
MPKYIHSGAHFARVYEAHDAINALLQDLLPPSPLPSDILYTFREKKG